MLTLYRRHLKRCSKADDRYWKRCSCPMWVEGTANGIYLRRSLQTASWERAQNPCPPDRIGRRPQSRSREEGTARHYPAGRERVPRRREGARSGRVHVEQTGDDLPQAVPWLGKVRLPRRDGHRELAKDGSRLQSRADPAPHQASNIQGIEKRPHGALSLLLVAGDKAATDDW